MARRQLSGRARGGRLGGDAPDLHRALSRLLESGRGEWDRSGVVIGWALRWVLRCCGVVLLGIGMLDRGAALLPDRAAQSGSGAPAAAPASNTIVYMANERGHVVLGAAVNGVPVRMLVDTGASLVTLTRADARAAGIGELMFNGRVETANGSTRMAPVTLREVRIGQLSIYDVPAAV